MEKHADDVVVQAEPLKKLVGALYQRVGVPPAEAEAVAALQVETDLRGVFSHGTRSVPGYVRNMQKGSIEANPAMKVVRESVAHAVLDGDRGLGHVAAMRGMRMAIAKAREAGTGTVAVRNSHHFGPAAAYAMMALEHNMMGFATTSTGGPSVAAFGSKQAAVGNNPLAWAIPARGEPPVVLDMACGVSAWGRVGTMRLYGLPLTPGWCLDENGSETTDPAQARIMLPAGGAKGYGLAFVCSALAGALVGGLMPIHKRRGVFDHSTEHFFYALNIAAFVELDDFFSEIESAVRDIRQCAPAAGFDRVYLPGEIEWHKSQRWRQSGIPLHKDHLKGLAEVAKELGVEIFWEQPHPVA